jgi:hypothetical protein
VEFCFDLSWLGDRHRDSCLGKERAMPCRSTREQYRAGQEAEADP